SKSYFVRSFIAAVGPQRLRVEKFPGYAPELNPAEGLWYQIKGVELKNVCSIDLSDLKNKLRTAVSKIRSSPKLIQSFFGQTGLEISEFKYRS
ncbi:MAG: hypothetical protein HQK53_07245, partial [Oligoflexia bacterium]|nr:hypothetical protein [Oligoflexia bacterium]